MALGGVLYGTFFWPGAVTLCILNRLLSSLTAVMESLLTSGGEILLSSTEQG